MRNLSENLYKRKKEIDLFLRERNRWSSLPRHLRTFMNNEDNLKCITFISQNPDNINGQVKTAYHIEYDNITTMIKDMSVYEEWGIVNFRPGKGTLGRNMIRLTFMLKTDIEVTPKCISEDEQVQEKGDDFLKDMMGGKL